METITVGINGVNSIWESRLLGRNARCGDQSLLPTFPPVINHLPGRKIIAEAVSGFKDDP